MERETYLIPSTNKWRGQALTVLLASASGRCSENKCHSTLRRKSELLQQKTAPQWFVSSNIVHCVTRVKSR